MNKECKLIMEYVIRHFKLNAVCVGMVDTLLRDQKRKREEGARGILQRAYMPARFQRMQRKRTIDHRYHLQIIVPMYNVKKYIIPCLNSILNQETAYSYCVYVVDDGSTDGSLEKVRNFFPEGKIVLISKKNEGTASARNAALEEMVADYVMFVDADDMLKPGAVTKLLDAAYRADADVVEGGYEVFRGRVRSTHCHREERLEEACGMLWGFSWAKVFRGELFCDFRFPDHYWYEDTFLSYLIYTKCDCAVTIRDVIYSYRSNLRGVSRIRKEEKKILDAFWIIILVIEEMLHRNVFFSQNVYEQLLVSMLTSSKRMLCLNQKLRRCVLSAYSEILEMYFPEFETEKTKMQVFEKVLRNNDYRKYRMLAVCMENM